MRTSKSILVILLILITVVTLPHRLIHCATNPVITLSCKSNGKEYQGVADLCADVNELLSEEEFYLTGGQLKDMSFGWDFMTVEDSEDEGKVDITLDMTNYKALSEESQQRVMQIVLSKVYNSSISRSNRNKLYSDICNLDVVTTTLVRQLSDDVKSDFAAAYSKFKPFSGTVGWIFGCIAIFMFITMSLGGVVDIFYINLPFAQIAFTQLAVMAGKPENGKPALVSLEAWEAVKEADSKAGTEYVSPNGLYMKSKVKQYIMVFICLLYLTSGQIFELVAKIMDYFRNFK